MERAARAAGAVFEVRDGWNVAMRYASTEQEREAARRAAGWADVSHLGKLEIQAAAGDLEAHRRAGLRRRDARRSAGRPASARRGGAR